MHVTSCIAVFTLLWWSGIETMIYPKNAYMLTVNLLKTKDFSFLEENLKGNQEEGGLYTEEER